MKALVQVTFSLSVLIFSAALLFCVVLGDALQLGSCALLLEWVLHTIRSVRGAVGW